MDKETKESLDRVANVLVQIREQLNSFVAGTFANLIVSRLNAIEKQLEKLEETIKKSN
jgi:hypothetical protein